MKKNITKIGLVVGLAIILAGSSALPAYSQKTTYSLPATYSSKVSYSRKAVHSRKAAYSRKATRPRKAAYPRKTTVLRVLQSREPNVKWKSGSLLKADLDFDGTVDYALEGRRGKSIVVGIVRGPLGSRSRHSTVPFTPGEVELCSPAGGISLERLNREINELQNLPKTGKGVKLGNECDDFHIYYNPTARLFTWWQN